MRKSKGFTLVELIIVIAIIAILGTFATIGIGYLVNQSGGVVSRDVYNMIGSAKTVAMSKDNCYYVLSADSEGNRKVCVMHEGSGGWQILQEAAINNTANITFTCGGTVYTVNGSGGPGSYGVAIEIDRATGAFLKSYFFSGDDANPCAEETPGVCSNIGIKQGSKVFDIVLVEKTGKYFYN